MNASEYHGAAELPARWVRCRSARGDGGDHQAVPAPAALLQERDARSVAGPRGHPRALHAGRHLRAAALVDEREAALTIDERERAASRRPPAERLARQRRAVDPVADLGAREAP